MPFRRRYGRRMRRRRGRPAWLSFIRSKKAVSNTGSLAYMAWKGVKRLKRLVNVEKKKFDQTIDTTVSTTGSVLPLSNVAQGDTDQTRDGNSIKPLYLFGRARMTLYPSGGDTSLRVILLRDTQQTADTTPVIGDILDGSFALDFTLCPLNNESVGRYTILSDRTYTMYTDKPILTTILRVRLGGHIRFNGVNGTDIQKNGLYLLLVSNQATEVPTFQWAPRLTYTDN